MKFSIITPSFRSGRWLKLCIASVADQEGVEYEHIVQDSCSDDETKDWLATDSRVTAIIEKDTGMYDAVNRGFKRATGDIMAYINCDEQYLPGALKKVEQYFKAHPGVDALVADAVVVNPEGEYMCERRALSPLLHHTQVGSTLSFLTAALFLRRSAVEKHQLYFDTSFRIIGDVEWAIRAIRAGIRFETLGDFTSSFTRTGENLSLDPRGREEGKRVRTTAPAWVQATARAWDVHHRIRRFAAGHYTCKPHDYWIYTSENPAQRKRFEVTNPTFRWIA
jgi:glycosyltransferase involved in cell wall biosynthesis